MTVGINSIIASQYPHVAVFDGYEVQTHGNHHAHLVLRGSNHAPNYSIMHLEEVKHHMERHQIINPSVVIDVSHDNCMINGKKIINFNHQLHYPSSKASKTGPI